MTTDNKAAALVEVAKKWGSFYGPFSEAAERAALGVPLLFQSAWEKNDASAIADLFVDNGSLIFGDEKIDGPDDIRAFLEDSFAGYYKGSRVREKAVSVRFPQPDLALVVTVGSIDGDDAKPSDGPSNRWLWTMLKQNGQWKLVNHQYSPLTG